MTQFRIESCLCALALALFFLHDAHGQTFYSYTKLDGFTDSFDTLPAAEAAMRTDFNNNGFPGDKLKYDKGFDQAQTQSYPPTH